MWDVRGEGATISGLVSVQQLRWGHCPRAMQRAPQSGPKGPTGGSDGGRCALHIHCLLAIPALHGIYMRHAACTICTHGCSRYSLLLLKCHTSADRSLNRGRVPLPCSYSLNSMSFDSLCHSVTSVARCCDLVVGLRDALCHPGDEGRWAEALRQHGPLGFVCERAACELCRPEMDGGQWRRLVSGAGGSGVDTGSGSGVRHSMVERTACGLHRQVGTESDTVCCSAISGDASRSSSSGVDGHGGVGAGAGAYREPTTKRPQQQQQRAQLQQQKRPAGYCPARRLALNTSIAFWQLLPPLSRVQLRTGNKGYLAEVDLHDMCRALTAVCMRVQAEEYQQQQQQQQQQLGAAAKPPGGGKASRGRGAAAPSGAQGGAHGRSAVVGSAVAGASTEGGSCGSWRELLLSLQPFRLIKLAMQTRDWRGDFNKVIPAALSALALAVPEPFAAALAADPELAACVVQRVRSGGQGGEPDGNLAGVLQRVLPALPPCRAVEALEAKCALPMVSRAKRQAAREGLRRAWAARARACVLVGVREVQEALAGD